MFSKYLGIKPVYFKHSAEIENTGCSRCNQLNPVEEGKGKARGRGGAGRERGGRQGVERVLSKSK